MASIVTTSLSFLEILHKVKLKQTHYFTFYVAYTVNNRYIPMDILNISTFCYLYTLMDRK